MSFLSTIDQPIDSIVNEVLEAFKTDNPQQFKAKVQKLSPLSRFGLKAFVAEQIMAEPDAHRRQLLLSLKDVL